MKKDAKFYIIYSIIISFFIVSSANILNTISNIVQKTYNPLPLARTSFAVLFFFGVILGFEILFNEKKNDGKWKFNSLRLIILGVPSLIVIIWFWFPRLFGVVLINALFPSILSNNIVYNFSVVLFGWALTTSIYKYDSKELD